MIRRTVGAMDFRTASMLALTLAFLYSSWLTSIVFCSANGMRPLLIVAAIFPPVGVVHGIGVWCGGW